MVATIGRDRPGARHLRRYAPLLVILALAVAIITPGMIAESVDGQADAAMARPDVHPASQATAAISE